MTATIECLVDIASPNAYLAWAALEETDIDVAYTPILLGGLFKLTNNQSPMMAFSGVSGKLAYEMKEIDRFVERHGLSSYKFSSHFPPNSVTAMRVLTAALRDGGYAVLLGAMMRGMWEQDRELSDAHVVRAVADDAGLDGAGLVASAGTDEIKDTLKARTQAAADRGAFGVPTFFVDGEMWFGKERIGAVLEAACG